MQLPVERGIGFGDHADLEEAPRLAAEDHGERDDQRQREQEVEDERRTVAQELEVARGPDRQQAPEVHVRNSRPVSSRNRSSRFRGRILRCFSGIPRSRRVRSASSTSAVEISTRSPARSSGSGNSAGSPRKVLARQLQHDVVEVLLEQARGRALGDDAAAVHDGDLVAQEVGLFHVMGRQQHRAAFRLDGADQVPEVVAGLRIEAGGRLVQEQHLRVVDERDRQQQALQLPPGQLAVVALRDLLERAQGDQLVDVAAARIEPPEQLQGLAHGQEVLQRRLLELDAGLGAKPRAERLARSRGPRRKSAR